MVRLGKVRRMVRIDGRRGEFSEFILNELGVVRAGGGGLEGD